MHYQEEKEVTLAQRCSQCLQPFRSQPIRYYCCKKTHPVCQKCSTYICKSCKKPRTNTVKIFQCSFKQCRKLYPQDDMFYDFKENYMFCPKCLSKTYSFFYMKSLKDKVSPKVVKLDSQSVYPYQDLVNYFRQWCFCCANRIGKQDAYELRKGARICPSCVELNLQLMQHMIKCIECQGFIRNPQEIYQKFENQVDVLCTYCANKQKEELTKHEIQELESPTLRSKKNIVSALEKSKLKQMKSIGESKVPMISKMSKVSTQNSFEKEMLDLPLTITHSNFTEKCELCWSILDKQRTVLLKKEELSIFPDLKIKSNVQSLRLCFICFGQHFTDRGQTIQFQTPLFRGQQNQEEHNNSPVKGVKATIINASHGLFSGNKH